MTLLHGLWVSSLIGAVGAVSWMVLLIAARIAHDAFQPRRERLRAAIVDIYMALMQDEPDAAARLNRYRSKAGVMAEALLNLFDVVRGQDREQLIRSLDAFGFAQLLRGQLRRGDEIARLAAIEALAFFPGPGPERALQRVTRQHGAELRLAAVNSLLMIGARIDLPALLGEMQRHREPWSGSMIGTFRLLAEHQPDDCAVAFARTDVPIPIRVMLADALGASGNYKVLPILSEAAMGETPRIRSAGIKALGRLMHPACEPVLARGAVDPNPRVRGVTAIAIGDAGLTSLIPRLVTLLGDPFWWIRFYAAESLARMGPVGRDALRQAATGADKAADMAAMTLAERGLG